MGEAELDAEDAKLLTLARGARARVGAEAGAAVRDETGRTYSAAEVSLSALRLSALDLALAQAWSSGARGIEAAVVVSVQPEAEIGLAVAAELGGRGVPVLVCGTDGSVARRLST